MQKVGVIDWILRVVKGMFIGSGAILPGVSGGALAAVFGIYERIITFLSNIRKDFKKNVLFFIPVGIGGVLGFFLLSHPIKYFLEVAPIQTLWCFIGCILGTVPALYREAGKKGRKRKHILITALTAIFAFIGLFLAKTYMDVSMPQNFGTWMMAGAIFAFGFIVPGLSPSNFLMYLHLYEPMNNGIASLDFQILLPVGIGALLCVLLFAKLIGYLMKVAYAPIFHFILGIIIASTAIIVPLPGDSPEMAAAFDTLQIGGILLAILLCVGGVVLGLWMGRLEAKYKPVEAPAETDISSPTPQ